MLTYPGFPGPSPDIQGRPAYIVKCECKNIESNSDIEDSCHQLEEDGGWCNVIINDCKITVVDRNLTPNNINSSSQRINSQ